ncbi:High affinity cationic amino acid transporter 1 [Fasciola hepatica]|uniref:High affinity cationic amino acid transporter 1 n=1 Tax=Fasciola hepatica TaxID=6192 RepID=A0A4E0S2N8_FASHE|nr:High affinity cationic amino acid transporter 1 [Fasciola hepatica]
MGSNETAPIVKERKRGCNDLCEDYGEAVRFGVFRKKPLSADLEKLLSTPLKRCLNTFDLISYGLASMLGGSIYVLTGTVMRKRTGPAVFLAYLLAGVVAVLNAMVYSELACRIPKAGSSYSYAYILLGELLAFLTGWSILLEYILGTSTVARGWSSMLDGLTGGAISQWILKNVGRLSPPGGVLAEYPDLIGVALILIAAGITCCGVRGSARMTGVFIFINFCVLVVTSIYMFVYSNTKNLRLPVPSNVTDANPYSPDPTFIPFGLGGLMGGVAICFNAFIGFDAISTCAEETRSPSKDLPRANFAAVFFVTAITVVASLALTLYHPWYLVTSETPFLVALSDNLGGGPSTARTGMFYFVGIGCLIGLSSSLLSNLVAGPRINYAMSEDGLLPKYCSNICQPFRTPAIATAFVALVTALLDLLFSVESLADFLSLGTLIAYSIASIGLLRLRYANPPECHILRSASNKYIDDPLPSIEGTTDDERVEQILHTADEEISRIDQPGYLKARWANCMPQCTVKFFNRGRPGDSVMFLVTIYLVLMCILIILIKVGAPEGLWPVWRIVAVVVFLLALIFLILLMCAFVQHKSPYRDLFRLPLVPLFPCATMTVNMFLIAELSWITWARFAIWCGIGLIIYFTYGVCYSSAAAQEGHPWALGTPPKSTDNNSPDYVVTRSR